MAKAKKGANDTAAAVQVIDVKNIKESDPVAQAKMIEAEKLRVAYEKDLAEKLEPMLNKKKAEKVMSKEVNVHSQPMWATLVAILGTLIFAVVTPLFGWFVMETMT
jgi:GTPase involved in cell partitioning and DNA repair